MAENTIDNLSIQVTASAENAARVFDRLASSAGRLRGAAQGAAGGMQDMAQGARGAGTATQQAGTQSGRARPNIKGVGKDAKDAGDNAKKGASGLATFWQSLKRIAFYRAIRSVIREITDAFKTGITNLYHWSDLVNGHFAASMDRLATSSQYLKNSLGAMVSPLIETLVPVLDVIIDKIVDVINFFNMLVSAVSGADTYTVAKKAAAEWDDAGKNVSDNARKTAQEIKRTILGFDEINKLVKPNSSSSGSGSTSGKKPTDYSSMFEEKPLTGIFKKISDITSGWPDWLKALLGVGTAGLAIFGIPALLKTIWDWLKKLFTIKIPDWFKWLFGPKGDGNNGLDIPKEINLPDGEIKVKLNTDDIEELKIPVSPNKTGDGLFKDLRTDWNKNKTTLFVNDKLLDDGGELFKALRTEWNKNKTTLFADVRLLKTGGELFKELRTDWNNVKTTLMIDDKLLKTGSYLFKELRTEWNKFKTTLFVPDKLLDSGEELFKEFRTSWNKAKTTLFAEAKLLKTGNDLFQAFRNEWNKAKTTLFVDVSLLKTGDDLFRAFRTEWNNAKTTLFAPNSLLKTGVELFKTFRTEWNNTKTTLFATNSLLKTGSELFSAFRTEWNNAKTTLFVSVELEKKGWTTVNDYINDNFGGATGGGGQTSGGGAGRGRGVDIARTVNVDVGLTKKWNSATSELGIDNLNTDVDVGLNRTWGGQGALSSLGIDNLDTDVDVGLKQDGWTSVSGWIKDNHYNATTINQKVGLEKNGWDWVDNWAKQYAQTPISQKVNLDLGRVDSKITNYFGGKRAKGGVFSGGHWSNIPQYAGGTSNVRTGSLFWAGENGNSEIVGNAGGRTEVLNKSQIASAMYSAVQAAMAPAAANFAAAAENMGVAETGFDLETLAEMIRQGVEQAMSRSNDYDRQKVDLLRSINDKDFNVDVSTASINKAQSRMNRRAGVTIAPVGT
jgi:hypothetical protein